MNDYQGLTLKFSGDASELLATLKKIDSVSTATQTSLSQVSNALHLDPTSAALYEAQTKLLNKALGEEIFNLSNLKAKHEEVNAKISKAKQRMNELEQANRESTEEYKDLERACSEWEEQLDNINNKIAISEATIKGYSATLDEVSKQEILNTTEWGKAAQGLDSLGRSLTQTGNYLTNVLGLRLTMIESALAMGFGRSVLNEVEDYTNAISRVGGYLDITGAKLEQMSELALYWGKETQFSATEAADAMSELAKGGMTQAQIAGGALEATMQLAAAGGIDMATAAGVAVNAIKVFGLSAEDATDVADALAGAANKSTAEISDLSSAFRYVSGWAGLADYSINDVSGALGLLADYGLTGQMAGTGLRNVIQRLAAPTNKAKELLEEYGVEVYDSSGKVKDLTSLVGELSDAFSGLDEETRNSVLNTIFGARGLPAAVALMEAGQGELESYIDATKREGYALEMMQARMGDIGWALEYLRGEFETFKVSIGKAMEPRIIEVANAIERMLASFNSWSAERQRSTINALIKLLAAAPGAYALGTLFKIMGGGFSGLSKIVLLFGTFTKNLRDGSTVAESYGAAVEAMTKGSVNAAQALTRLKVAFGSVIAVAAIYTALRLWEQFEKAQKRASKLNTIIEQTNRLMGRSGPKTNTLARGLFDISEAAESSAKSLDGLLEDVVDFYRTVDETFRQVEVDTGRLNKAWEIISKFGGRDDLSPEQLELLAGAIGVVNSELGTSYALHSDTSGVIYDENDNVVNLTTSIWRLIEAQKAQIKANAYGSLLEDAYKRQAEAIDTAAQKQRDYLEWSRKANDPNLTETERGYASVFAEEAFREWQQAEQVVDETTMAVERLGSEYDEASLAAQRAAEATQNGVAEIGSTIDGFDDAFKEAGLSVSDFVGLTNSEFGSMVEAADGDFGLLMQMLRDWLAEQPIEAEFTSDTSGVEQGAAEAESAAASVEGEHVVTFYANTTDAVENTNAFYEDIWGIPTSRETKLDADARAADHEITETQRKLGAVPEEHITQIDADAWSLFGVVDSVIKSINGIPSIKTVTIDTITKSRHLADGGILYRHADGYITNHSIYSGNHVIGEAGIEAVLPLNNRAATQPLVDAISDGVSRRIGGGNQYNLYINDARVNDDPAIRSAFIDLMGAVNRKGMQTNAAR